MASSSTDPLQYTLVGAADQEAGDVDSGDSTGSEQIDKEFLRNFGNCPPIDEVENGWEYLRRTADAQAEETLIIGPVGGKNQLCATTATKNVLISPEEAEMLADIGSRAGWHDGIMEECVQDGFATIVDSEDLGRRERKLTDKEVARVLDAAHAFFPAVGGPIPRLVFYKLVEFVTRRYKDPVDAIRSSYSAYCSMERVNDLEALKAEFVQAKKEGREPKELLLDTDERLRTGHQAETAAAVAALVACPARRERIALVNHHKTFEVQLDREGGADKVRTLEEHERDMQIETSKPWMELFDDNYTAWRCRSCGGANPAREGFLGSCGTCGAAGAQAWGGYIGRALSGRELNNMKKRMRRYTKATRRKKLRKRIDLLRRGIDPKIALDKKDDGPKWRCVNVNCGTINDSTRQKCYKCSYFKDEAAKREFEARGKDPSARQGRRAGKRQKKKKQHTSEAAEETAADSSNSGHDSEAQQSEPGAKKRAIADTGREATSSSTQRRAAFPEPSETTESSPPTTAADEPSMAMAPPVTTARCAYTDIRLRESDTSLLPGSSQSETATQEPNLWAEWQRRRATAVEVPSGDDRSSHGWSWRGHDRSDDWWTTSQRSWHWDWNEGWSTDRGSWSWRSDSRPDSSSYSRGKGSASRRHGRSR